MQSQAKTMYATKKNLYYLLQKKDFFFCCTLFVLAKLTFILLTTNMICLCLLKNLQTLIYEKLCKKCEITYIWSEGDL